MAPDMDVRTHRVLATFLDPRLERQFRADYFERSVKSFTRFSIGLSAVAFLAYGIHDLLVIPSIRSFAWALRYGVFGPVAVLVTALMHSRKYEPWHQPAMLVFGMGCNVVVIAIAAVAPTHGYFIYNSFAILFVTLGPLVAKMNVFTQALYTLLTVFVYVLFDVVLVHAEDRVRVSMILTIVVLGGIGTLVAHQLELQAREGFLQRRTIYEQMDQLDHEKGKSDALLLNILPAKIAERLKREQGRTIADGFAQVTVLFSDIVGFTKMAERLAPSEVVRRLNAIFSTFDDMADRLGLEKIKTIGDAYMVAGGLPTSKDDHAHAVSEMALEMCRYMEEFSRELGEPVRVRIGVHTGPVVAGVIGKKKFIYDVWGDTVNTASRMESHGIEGRIQVTEATYERIKDHYDLEERGEIDVKGKGLMKTYWLRGRRDRLATPWLAPPPQAASTNGAGGNGVRVK
ncbi:adenylate/guanylate cyclase domain-containing protein [Pendulispora albinea]|uniref:Guanylate cyclase domain-containing protein n=1 Tax=Pendulispora albinea TaxID=2741071 RepID=A0ABZ2LQ19_9BACT